MAGQYCQKGIRIGIKIPDVKGMTLEEAKAVQGCRLNEVYRPENAT